MQRSQHPSGDDPTEDSGEREDCGERYQRVLQQMREGEIALVLCALKLEVRVALGEQAVVGLAAQLLGAAAREKAGRSLLPLDLRLETRDQDVAHGDDDRPAYRA